MTPEQFAPQLNRLRIRFGDRALDKEFSQLVWREVHDMSEQAFTRFVDVMIGSRPHTKPPLLAEFREARLNERKRAFDNEVQAVTRGTLKPLADVLRPDFGGVSGVKEALEIARLRQRTKRGDGPKGSA